MVDYQSSGLELDEPKRSAAPSRERRAVQPEEAEWRRNLASAAQDDVEEPPPHLLSHLAVLALQASGVVALLAPVTSRTPERTHLLDCALVYGAFSVLFILDVLGRENARYWANRAQSRRRGATARAWRPPRDDDDSLDPGKVRRRDGLRRRGADANRDGELSLGESARAHSREAAGGAGATGAFLFFGLVFVLNFWLAAKIPRVVLWPLAVVLVVATLVRAADLTESLSREDKQAAGRAHIHEQLRRR